MHGVLLERLSGDRTARRYSTAQTRGWLSELNMSASTWDYGFFVGGLSAPEGSLVSSPDHHTSMHGDMVRLAVPDDYAHLAQKVLRALAWTSRNVESTYVLKADMDTWIDPEGTSAWLREPRGSCPLCSWAVLCLCSARSPS